MKVSFTCSHCGSEGNRERGQLNRLAREGRKPYCSHQCSTDHRQAEVKAPGWHEQRFTARPTAVQVACAECGRDMWLPASKVDMYKRCGEACNRAWRERTKKVVVIRARVIVEKKVIERKTVIKLDRPCETCGTTFRPRPNQVRKGHGRYCSQKCNKAFHEAGQRPDVWARRIETMREMRANGDWTILCGERNPAWAGGYRAAIQRRIASGKAAEQVRRYRQNHPEKVREFASRRKSRKHGRLPRGTVSGLFAAQKGRCAICRVSIRPGYHLDHIMPLARGGKHVKSNLQLLCPPCNLRKSDRDPIVHMQSLGRLL